ncbi:hypothetical protein [Cupriavidus sp. USMAA2-4]|uniref:hypothetical protein n=1 Tax=Cupriavidus sp. USMAA2-4 TaxID=876364 RepID=UPI0009FF8E3D|nr:hypothetical protein [Cupriavidus sp. USMAA2-4]
MSRDQPLPDGRYRARCRERCWERSLLGAAANGHSRVYPSADLVVVDGWAHFYRDCQEVWSCNPSYAATHFDVVAQGR